ncbi:MAG: hypothetical protein M3345_06770 [Actinomycetota bacterium]|nr:hypothetical protein [Actinomycetota bacterium]
MTTDPAPRPEEGVQFAPEGERRSSQRSGKAIFADAARAVDPGLAHEIEAALDWRKRYMTHIAALVAAGTASAKDALRIAADGLDAVRRNLTFVRDGHEAPLQTAFDELTAPAFRTESIRGTGERVKTLQVPYRGEILQGDALITQLDAWVAAGTIEPSARDALALVVSNPGWIDLSDRHFVLLGAASEMGPLEPLCAWGAHVIAVDLPRAQLWSHIAATARAGSGTLHVPVPAGIPAGAEIEQHAGADLLTQAPEIRTWLTSFPNAFTLGNYLYADGATFVRLAGVADALIADVLERRADTSLAYLATPTDCFAVPQDVVAGAATQAGRSPVRAAARAVSRGKLYAPNYARLFPGENDRSWGISDALMPIQGPNYAVAKSLQRWRAVTAREEGAVSSANVAPASSTRSVVKNRLLAAAYKGAPAFGIEIFEPATSRALTAALLVHDLRDPKAAANPLVPVGHPYDLFAQGAIHGGMWRLPFEARSVMPVSVLRGLVSR